MYGETATGNTENTPASEKVYVKFGPHPTDEMPIEWAQKMLTAWKEKDPKRFGNALAEVVTGGR